MKKVHFDYSFNEDIKHFTNNFFKYPLAPARVYGLIHLQL